MLCYCAKREFQSFKMTIRCRMLRDRNTGSHQQSSCLMLINLDSRVKTQARVIKIDRMYQWHSTIRPSTLTEQYGTVTCAVDLYFTLSVIRASRYDKGSVLTVFFFFLVLSLQQPSVDSVFHQLSISCP